MSEVPDTAAVAPRPVSRHAVTFVLITVFLDMVGFGLIMPVLPKLIEDVGHVDIAHAAVIGGWMFAAFSPGAVRLCAADGQPVPTGSGAGRFCCWRSSGWGWTSS